MERRGIKLWLSACLLVGGILAGLSGCSDDSTTKPPTELAPPTNLTFLNSDNAVTLDWNASPDASNADGYVVYRGETSMTGLTLDVLNNQHRLTASPIASTSYTDNTAENGTKFYYAVRLQKGSDYSEATSEINTAGRVESGSLVLSEFSSPNASGLGLALGQVLTMTSTAPNDNRSKIDIYLGTDSATDASSAALAIKSPHLVGNSDPDWSARNADLKLLDSFDDPTTSDQGWSDKIVLGSTSGDIVGKVIAIRTPADNQGQVHYAKIRIDATSGAAGQRQITVTRAYQTIPNYIRFAVPRR